MTSKLTKEILDYLEASVPEAHQLLKELCLIPAPSHFEDQRAAYIKAWLENIGAKGCYIDEAKNVVLPLGCEGNEDIICFEAHTDTVFPADTPLQFTEDEDKYYCPGIGDDTANLVNMLMIVKYIVQKDLQPACGVLFVANSCEEGLGNLKGTRQIFKDYGERIKRFISFDGGYTAVTSRAVGSCRYSIEAKTEGGHSWTKFGNTNAIVELSHLIMDLASIVPPVKEGSRTTFNVGTIQGGTSVNTIAQNASMLYEYRSDDVQCLDLMKKAFLKKVENFRRTTDAEVNVTVVGERPCGEVKDKAVHQAMIDRALEVCRKYSGMDCSLKSSSTDCNIPLSLGIPAICFGLYDGGGAHTREEWIYKESIGTGLKIAAEIVLEKMNGPEEIMS